MRRNACRLFLLLGLSLTTPMQVVADNGSLTEALPLTGIVIDGDLSDWPGDFPVHPVRWNREPYGRTDLHGVDLETSLDLDPQFSVAWDSTAQLLYVAVRVRDDELRVGVESGATDACEIYLHVPGQTATGQLVMCPPGGSYDGDENPIWQVKRNRQGLLPRMRTAVSRSEDITVYEAALDPVGMVPALSQLGAGMSFGFDVIVIDKDDDEHASAWVAWGPGRVGPKLSSPGSLGDVVLASEPILQTVSGTVVSDDEPVDGLILRARSEDGLVQEAISDSLGRFGFRVPVGRWHMEALPGQGVTPFVRVVEVSEEPIPAVGIVVEITSGFLGRLVLHVRPELRKAFSAAYEEQLLPALGRRGWVPSSESPRLTADSLFCRLFERPSLSHIERDRAALRTPDDVELSRLLAQLDARFGTGSGDQRLQADFHVYATAALADLLSDPLTTRLPAGHEEPLLGQRLVVEPGASVPARVTRTTAGPGTHRGSWRSFTWRDGLPRQMLRSTYRDQAGQLWTALLGGVMRYDGRWFTSYEMPDSTVTGSSVDWYATDMLTTPDGHVWVATIGGVIRFDGTEFTTFPDTPILSDRTTDLTLDEDGSIWVGSLSGLARLKGSSLTVYTATDGLPNDEVWSTTIGPRGALWVTTGGRHVSRFDGAKFQPVIQAGISHRGSSQTSSGWFAAQDQWAHFDGERFEMFGATDGFPDPQASTGLQLDGEGAYWTVQAGGVVRIAQRQQTLFTAADGVIEEPQRLLADEHGVWVLSLTGLSLYEEPRLQTFRVEDGLADNKVICLLEAGDGRIWVGTDRGVSVFEEGRLRPMKLHAAVDTNAVRDIYQDRRGDVWFATVGDFTASQGGAIRWDGHEAHQYTTSDGLGSNWVASITEDSDGDLWFATPTVGVSRFDGEGFTVYETVADLGITPRTIGVWRILEHRPGDLWFATAIDGIRRFDGERFTPLTQADGLLSDTPRPLVKDRAGRMWIGTHDAGITVYDDGRFVDSLTADQGLSLNSVRAILEDSAGHIWVGTYGAGVTLFAGDLVLYLDSRNGLAHNKVYDLLEDRRGDIWIATVSGLTRFRPDRHPRGASIKRVVADDVFEPGDDIEVPSTQERVAFEFGVDGLAAVSQSLVYQYRLLEHETDWSMTREQQVEYSGLPVGKYRFEVRAVDEQNLSRSDVAAVELYVHPPYMRYSAMGGAALVVLIMTGQALRIVRRGRRLAEANEALASTNEELTRQRVDLEQAHAALQESQAQLIQSEKMATLGLLAGGVAHEINNPLQTILNGARRILRHPHEASRHMESAELVEQAARRCSGVVQSLLGYARSERRAGEPVDLNEVIDTTLALLAGQFRSAGVEVVVQKGEGVTAKGDFGDMCTVLTNLLVNARDAAVSVEGDRPRVHVSTTVDSGHVWLRVWDNGPGLPDELRERIFDPFFTTKDVGQGSGLGLSIVRTMLERHGGSIVIESAPGEGAKFAVQLRAAESNQGGGTA